MAGWVDHYYTVKVSSSGGIFSLKQFINTATIFSGICLLCWLLPNNSLQMLSIIFISSETKILYKKPRKEESFTQISTAFKHSVPITLHTNHVCFWTYLLTFCPYFILSRSKFYTSQFSRAIPQDLCSSKHESDLVFSDRILFLPTPSHIHLSASLSNFAINYEELETQFCRVI